MAIIRNAIKCKLCGAIIDSTHRHDFNVHACDGMPKGEFIAADGGKDYLRRVGDSKYWEDVSECTSE